MKKRLDDKWLFWPEWNEEILSGKEGGEEIRIPHTVKEMPLHYGDPMDYQMVSGYRRKLQAEKKEGCRYFLQFDGAAHIADVYFNGKKKITHKNGYTAFGFEITDDLQDTNEIAVKLDSRETCNVPPFGFVIDYLTYGGIYRHVWLEERPECFIQDAFVTTPDLETVDVDVKLNGINDQAKIHVEILNKEGKVFAEVSSKAVDGHVRLNVKEVHPWTPETPVLYTCRITYGEDVRKVRFGFRTISFDQNHLLLNGEPYFFRGLNRHQSYPYMGYAAADHLQVEDVRILKEELGVNAVRTSHYPQSHAFLDACDEMGLLVFTEIPGWQHLGDREWKQQAVDNVKEMILEYRNHTSIFLWGVRINESVDDDDLYRQTNDLAHRLDPTRPTSGVRYLEKSSLLEDVYAYNDFSHNGITPGAKAKKDVTTHMDKPLLISEANGHMFPTKTYDSWQKRQEHALRHGRVLNAAMEDGEHAGCYQWCMFDYATHKDFGSGDRICYHGVMDSFRNPKLAAALYASQSDDRPVLEIGSSMDIGDYPAGHIDSIYAFTNADEVRLYKNDDFVKAFKGEEMKGLYHSPVLIDDTIGCLLATKEGFTGTKERLVHDALQAAGKYGMPNLPVKYVAMLAWCMARYGMTYEKGVELYGKYVGSWGGDSTKWRFEAVKNGEVVKEVVRCPSTKLSLNTRVSKTELYDNDTYDMAAIRISIEDEYGNVAPYAQLPLRLKAEGPIEIVGPDVIVLEGGMSGTYIKTTGKEGSAKLTITCDNTASVEIDFTIQKGESYEIQC